MRVDEPVDEDASESPVDFVLSIHVAAIGESSGLWGGRDEVERELDAPSSTTSCDPLTYLDSLHVSKDLVDVLCHHQGVVDVFLV